MSKKKAKHNKKPMVPRSDDPTNNKPKYGISASALAAQAGISLTTCRRKLARGKTPAEIMQEAEEYRAQMQELQESAKQLVELRPSKVRAGGENEEATAATTAPGPGPGPARGSALLRQPETLVAAQARKERALADLKELELALKRQSLVPLVETNAFVAGMIVKTRDRMLRLELELPEMLAVETDPAKIREILSEAIRGALNDMKEFVRQYKVEDGELTGTEAA